MHHITYGTSLAIQVQRYVRTVRPAARAEDLLPHRLNTASIAPLRGSVALRLTGHEFPLQSCEGSASVL